MGEGLLERKEVKVNGKGLRGELGEGHLEDKVGAGN